jgi:hypothetical protein
MIDWRLTGDSSIFMLSWVEADEYGGRTVSALSLETESTRFALEQVSERVITLMISEVAAMIMVIQALQRLPR